MVWSYHSKRWVFRLLTNGKRFFDSGEEDAYPSLDDRWDEEQRTFIETAAEEHRQYAQSVYDEIDKIVERKYGVAGRIRPGRLFHRRRIFGPNHPATAP